MTKSIKFNLGSVHPKRESWQLGHFTVPFYGTFLNAFAILAGTFCFWHQFEIIFRKSPISVSLSYDFLWSSTFFRGSSGRTKRCDLVCLQKLLKHIRDVIPTRNEKWIINTERKDFFLCFCFSIFKTCMRYPFKSRGWTGDVIWHIIRFREGNVKYGGRFFTAYKLLRMNLVGLNAEKFLHINESHRIEIPTERTSGSNPFSWYANKYLIWFFHKINNENFKFLDLHM